MTKRWYLLNILILTSLLLTACAPAQTPSPTAAVVVTESAASAPATSAPAEPTPQPVAETEVAATESADEKTTVIIGMSEALEFLNVIYTQGGNSLSASKLAQRGLLFLDGDSNWVGELAKEVPSLANGGVSEDGKQLRFISGGNHFPRWNSCNIG